jgi:hypothetical protein
MKATILCCAVALAAGLPDVGAQRSDPLAAVDWGSASDGLRMAISSVTAATERPEERGFYVAIENVGDRDVVLNLGSMIANGKVMFPEAVRLLLTDSQGTARELQYFDRRYPVIAGRVDDFIVALRAGSLYAIRVSLDHYWSSATNDFGVKLGLGRYRIEARFDGRGARSLNLDTPGVALLNFWKGTLRSNSLAFDIP